jgi:RNA polymerase sigma-70 factor (ECF subfamily)
MAKNHGEFVEQRLQDAAFLDLLKTDVAGIFPGAVDREDLFQDVVLRALKDRDSFDGDSDQELRAWLRTIARHRAIDSLRRSGKTPQASGEMERLGSSETPNLGAALETRESIDAILALLTPFEAALLRARYQGGLSFPMIGKILNLSPDQVRQTHHRLLKRVRESLRADHGP